MGRLFILQRLCTSRWFDGRVSLSGFSLVVCLTEPAVVRRTIARRMKHNFLFDQRNGSATTTAAMEFRRG